MSMQLRLNVVIGIVCCFVWSSCNLFQEAGKQQYEESWEFDNQQMAASGKNTPPKKSTKPSKKTKRTPAEKAPLNTTVKAPAKTETASAKASAITSYEKKWKIDIPATANVKLLDAVDSWIGTPYRYGGKDRNGTDCSAFCMNIYLEVYRREIARSTKDILEQARTVKREDLKEGDLVFFKINSSRVSHVGIYLYNGNFVHASTSRGVMISNLSEAYWTRYWHTGGRILALQ